MCVQIGGPKVCPYLNATLGLIAAGVAVDTFRSVTRVDETKKDIEDTSGNGNGGGGSGDEDLRINPTNPFGPVRIETLANGEGYRVIPKGCLDGKLTCKPIESKTCMKDSCRFKSDIKGVGSATLKKGQVLYSYGITDLDDSTARTQPVQTICTIAGITVEGVCGGEASFASSSVFCLGKTENCLSYNDKGEKEFKVAGESFNEAEANRMILAFEKKNPGFKEGFRKLQKEHLKLAKEDLAKKGTSNAKMLRNFIHIKQDRTSSYQAHTKDTARKTSASEKLASLSPQTQVQKFEAPTKSKVHKFLLLGKDKIGAIQENIFAMVSRRYRKLP